MRIAKASDLETPGVRELIHDAIAQAERPEGKAPKPLHGQPPRSREEALR